MASLETLGHVLGVLKTWMLQTVWFNNWFTREIAYSEYLLGILNTVVLQFICLANK